MGKDNSLKWCYVGENKGRVMITCSKKEWETICKALELVSKVHIGSESDDWNYSYTGFDKRK